MNKQTTIDLFNYVDNKYIFGSTTMEMIENGIFRILCSNDFKYGSFVRFIDGILTIC